MAREQGVGTAPLDRCGVNGCAWRGSCPDHDREIEVDTGLEKLMRSRPFGAGRKHARSAARYVTTNRVKSKVFITTIEERRNNPPKSVRRRRTIVHPDTFPAVYGLSTAMRARVVRHPFPAPAEAPVTQSEISSTPPEAAIPTPVVGGEDRAPRPTPALLAQFRPPALKPVVDRAPVTPTKSVAPPRGRPRSHRTPVVPASCPALATALEAMRRARRDGDNA